MGRRRSPDTALATARSFDALKTWPADALDWLHAQFDRKRIGAGDTYAEILAALKDRWGLDWNDSSLSRYYGYWRSVLWVEDRASAEAEAILQGLTGGQPSEELKVAAKQMIEQQRLLALGRLGAADPAEVVRLGLAHDRNAIRARQVENDEKKLSLLERKLAAIEAKQAAADRQVGALVEAKTITPDVAKQIREIYGLGDTA